MKPLLLTGTFWGALALGMMAAAADPRVEVVRTDAGWQLRRNGEPYLIKGAGGDGSKELLAQAGGNSFRTWGADDLGKQLDEAQRLGLTVCAGIWLGHERHGFNYNNADQVAEQYEKARQIILRFKDHPALLLWALGNEMEGYAKGDNAAIWSAIQNLAAMAHKLDPHHPTMTVVAEIGGDRVKNLHRLCPDIDIVGINSYAGAPTLPQRYQEAGGTKPYVLTEFGPPGFWEVGKTEWGAPREPTSTEKAESYRQAWLKAIAAPKGLCLGGYAFTWGFKQEATATWFGMLLPDGARLAAVDAMTELWTGKPPPNRSPRIQNLKLAAADQVEAGATVRATVEVTDPEGDSLQVKWALHRESGSYQTGGDAQKATAEFADAIVKATRSDAELKMPAAGGGYRLFVFAYDGKGGAALANVPLRVHGPEPKPKAKEAKLPLIVYADEQAKPPFAPAGWMGDTAAIALDERCATNPHSGKVCLKAEFRKGDGWGGVVWQDPPGDWGDAPGGHDLTGAQKLTFWARGERGGEKIKFGLGVLGQDKRFHDTAKIEEEMQLTGEWKQYRLDLSGKDLSCIKTGFLWVLAGAGQPITFYLDDIRYE